jgi:hypothetical protein
VCVCVCVLGAVPFGYRVVGGLNTFDTIVEREVFFLCCQSPARDFLFISLYNSYCFKELKTEAEIKIYRFIRFRY